MKRSFLTLICLMASLSATQALATGDAAAGESKVAMCSGCHGSDGNSMVSAFPKLAGLGEKYMTQQLRLIKSGERVIVEMTGMLIASSDQDLQDMAAYYDSKTRQVSGAQDITLVGISNPEEALDYGENVYRGGNMNVVKAEPEIRQFQIHNNHDFIMLASDGVFDKMSNEDISRGVWESCDKNKWQQNPNFRPAQSVH